MRTIDADAHVIEVARTFEFIDPADAKLAPLVVTQTAGPRQASNSGGVHREHWIIDNTAIPKDKIADTATPDAAREMRDIEARLRHMDELEIDLQVLYPTMFLRPLTRKSRIEVAMAKSYNRWLAEIWAHGKGRLRWVVVPPLLDMAKVRDELAWGKEHGACGIFLNGLECDLRLSDEYFFPLYEAAAELDLPLCVHAGINSFTVHDFFLDDAFAKFKLPVIGAFHNLLMEGIPAKFPNARWGFIEVSAQWIPYVFKDLKGRFLKRGRRFPDNPLREYNIYVACEVSDDLPMILPYSGEDHLVVGTDYGHSDSSTEIEAMRLMKEDGRVPPHVVDKILGANPARLYGLAN